MRLAERNFAPGPQDGVPGARTFTALYACAAGRKADAAIAVRGAVAAERFAEFGMVTGPRIAEFIGGRVDVGAIAAAVDPRLYRNRV